MDRINCLLCVSLFLLLNLVGCGEEYGECSEEHIRIEAKKESTCQCEHHELYKEYNDLSIKRFLFGMFVRKTAEYSGYGSVLDNDFSIFIDYHEKGTSDFIYTKNKKKNFVYSTFCGVSEKLSPKQLEEINRLEEKMIKERQKSPVKGEWNISLFRWNGENQKKEPEVYLGSHFYSFKSDIALYEFFVKKIFVHGCKIHPFNIRNFQK